MTVGTRADRWIVNGSGIDYEAVFQALPGAVALLTPDLVYVDANEAFLVTSGRTREQLIGRYLFDVFPDNPGDPEATGMRNLRDSLERVAATGERDTMALQRYDVEHASRPGVWEERYWSPVNVPVLAPDGSVALLLHRVEEVTELIRARGGTRTDTVRARELASDLYLRGRELQEVNARLRQAHAREREVALHLQEAMLPAPRPLDHHEAAVRYRPATAALNVCGDWYDLVDMPERTAVAVGDVVGHGLRAAGVMGQLRSALSAASRVVVGPAQALEVLGLYARAIEGAESTTVVSVFIDWNDRTLTYSSAGHPPPALCHPDGTVSFLDEATDPPLGARPEHTRRPQARTAFTDGSVLALYTDGLIERRREDIDVGLRRLADALARHRTADPDALADALLADLIPSVGVTDDAALVILRLEGRDPPGAPA
ncbi:PP2C family protein-serine/threonine phosphatase [Streptomyces sp. NBC_00105]|uniref:PP2C family protein-serine/threonine phosphatase n=1 Tax=Streptomyces sp. NBC_00105 TaxID=2903622 RepID=UPI0028879BB7|nr:SpoIIE family protein phosphatase [Streptomyces sp. DSM 41633]